MSSKYARIRIPLLSLAVIALCVSIMSLWFDDTLSFYIHPRYVTFTTVTSLFGLIIVIADAILHASAKAKPPMTAYATFAFCLLALIAPVQTLSSRAVLNREQTVYDTSDAATTSYDEFSSDYSNLTLEEWVSLLNKNPPREQVEGKQATVEGFIVKDEDRVAIARFRIACCSVDATPLTIDLAPSTAQGLQENDWYRLSGQMVYVDGSYRLEVADVEAIDIPEQPYVF